MHAAIFGAILAIELCKSKPFFQAYCDTVLGLISGKAKIESILLNEFGEEHEIIARFHGAADNWRDLFIWGSPAFFA
jgi:hypothetical protein